MEKTVCYFATRNVYVDVVPSLKSLLKNGNIDRVCILAEDDDLGFDLPAKVAVYNVKAVRNKLLDPDGPNYSCRWTYMVMLKVALAKIFPRMHRALTLDNDTIVRGDVSALWDLPYDNVPKYGNIYYWGVREPYWTAVLQRNYANAGVLMWNLDKMRNGMADAVLQALNTTKYTFPEQDCLNDICRGQFGLMDAAYNAGDWTEAPKSEIRIRHYMATKGMWRHVQEVQDYRNMAWEEVLK